MNKPKKQPNKWLQLISIPFQMGFVIYGFYLIGQYVDQKNATGNWTKIMTLLGVFLSIYYVIKQVIKLNK